MTHVKAVISKGSTISLDEHSRYRFVIGGLILAANFSIGLQWNAISPLLPLVIDDFKIAAATASLLVALPVLLKSLVGLPGSMIISRFTLKRVFTISWYLVGALILSALVSNYTSLLSLRLIYGLGTGLMMPALGTLIMQWFPPQERTVMNSMSLVVMSLGVSIPYAVAVPLANSTSWKGSLGILGAVGLLGAVIWHILGRTKNGTEEVKTNFSFKEVWKVLSNTTIFLLVIGDSLVFAFYAALSNWLPTFYYDFRGMSLSQAGNVTGLLPFVGIFAVLVGGYLALKVKDKKWFFIIPGIMVMLGGFGSFLVENTIGIYVSVIVFGIGVWVYQPVLLSLPMNLPWMTPDKIAFVWGGSMTVAGFFMFLSPLIVGASLDICGSFLPGFIICAVPAVMLIFTGIFLPANESTANA